MLSLFSIRTLLIVFVFFMSGSASARTVTPTPLEAELFYRYLAGDPPNFEEEANKSIEYLRANEFEKPQALKKIITDLQRQYKSVQDIDLFMLTVSSGFSQYDATKEAYYLQSFRPDMAMQFGEYSLTFENADQFYEWHLGVAEAKKVLQQAPYRNLTLKITVRPFAVSQSREKSIRGQVMKVEIKNTENQLLANLSIPDSEMRAIQRVDIDQPVTAIEENKIEIQGLRLGTDTAAAQDWAKAKGFITKVTKEEENHVKEIRFATTSEAIEFKRAAIDPMVMLMNRGRVVDNDPGGFFGKTLNCRGTLDTPESCGKLVFDTVDGNVKLVSAILLQSAEGITKQQLVASLIEKFGEPRDRIKVKLLDFIEAEHFVWGTSSIVKDQGNQLTDLPKGQHWQVEAAIAQPDAKRMALVLQINDIKTTESGASTAGGRIKF